MPSKRDCYFRWDDKGWRIEVKDLDGMTDVLSILTFLQNPGRKIGIMGGGGAIGVYSSDLAYSLGLELPVFADETQNKLSAILPTPGASFANPIDMAAPTSPLELVISLIRETLKREPIDVTTRTFNHFNGLEVPSTEGYFEKLMAELLSLKAETGKDIVMVIQNRAHAADHIDTESTYRRIRHQYLQKGIPVFASEKKALEGINYSLTHQKKIDIQEHQFEVQEPHKQFLQQRRVS